MQGRGRERNRGRGHKQRHGGRDRDMSWVRAWGHGKGWHGQKKRTTRKGQRRTPELQRR